ncbi:MAG: hypothetical protein CM1200mP15_17530 [Dehalococcoidia bacterium]|nr:MAG: hypothetical protein CM1200mP15_17530 [Dehalococcoidia bacterium]
MGLAQARLARLKAEESISETPMMPQQVFPELNKVFPEGRNDYYRRWSCTRYVV